MDLYLKESNMKVIDLINNIDYDRYRYIKVLDDNSELIIKVDLRLTDYIYGLNDKRVLKYTFYGSSAVAWIKFDGW